jgi:FMN phosphatase YigB (HAD superfamily)
MTKLAIFDLNRTVYDPEFGVLVPGAREVLEELHERSWRLYLVSHAEGNFRQVLAAATLNHVFQGVFEVSTDKTKAFKEILKREPEAKSTESYIIGDRIRMEISQGNSLGFRTIWYRAGRFANETPRNKSESPTYTISELLELLHILT